MPTSTRRGDGEALRASLEHLIPKVRGALFNEFVSALADEVCHEGEPNCPSCYLLAECPTGQDVAASAVPVGRGGRTKPR